MRGVALRAFRRRDRRAEVGHRDGARLKRRRGLRIVTGKVACFPVVAPEGQPAVMPQPETCQWVTMAGKRAPRWENRVSVESLESGTYYDPTAFMHLISPTSLLMIMRHFDACEGSAHLQFLTPDLEWFQRHLMAR